MTFLVNLTPYTHLNKVSLECRVLAVTKLADGIHLVQLLEHFDVPDVVVLGGGEVRCSWEADLGGGAAPIQTADLLQRGLVGKSVRVDRHPTVHTLVDTVQHWKGNKTIDSTLLQFEL